MKTKLTAIFLSLSSSLMRKCLLVLLIPPFLMQISCVKDDTPETTETVPIENPGTPETTTGTIYYVSPTGNNTNAGTSGSPWATLAYAVTAVSSGDIIYMQAGKHVIPARLTLPLGVSLTGAGEASVITNTSLTSRINYGPNGSNGDAIINLVSSSVLDGNQSISYLKFDGASLTCSHAIYIMNRHNVKIHHCTFVNFNYSAVVWWAQGTGDGTPPATRLSGSEFYNNIVTNCAGYNSADASYYGALYCGGHTGMLIHDNIMIENGHSTGTQGWPIKFWLWGGMMNGCKIYNNQLEKTDYSVWDFAIESTGEDGMEIFNNTISGGVDLNKQNYSGTYTYSVYIHDNTIGPKGSVKGMYNAGITLEHNNSHVLVERNIIQNCSPAILFTPRATAQTEITIRYNIMKGIHPSSYYTEGITMNPGSSGVVINGFNIYNNIIHGTSGSTDFGIRLVHSGGAAITSATNVKIINNVIMNFNGYSGAPIYLTGGSAYSNLNIQNNIFYNNGTNAPTITGTPANYTNSGNLTSNPLFTNAGTDFTLQSGSPARDAGINVGLKTDYLKNTVPYNNIPDIGAYEYGSTSGS
ncbi:MAG: right-handed parallel beta-helix repeat-containing protein [Bacteroidales bacterium]|nr:right-handed parallel beta-helix repeat-containing protein [Bacteroidales bacterium]